MPAVCKVAAQYMHSTAYKTLLTQNSYRSLPQLIHQLLAALAATTKTCHYA